MRALIIAAAFLAGCSAEYTGPRGFYSCVDFRDGEKWQFHTNTIRDVRTTPGFTYTDTAGNTRQANRSVEQYTKCKFDKPEIE